MNRPVQWVLLLAVVASGPAAAGLFMFAEGTDNLDPDPNRITYPVGYTGQQSEVAVSVCIHPDSESISDMEIPLRNVLAVWNELEPVAGNLQRNDPRLASNEIDYESVLTHEVGHCIGLAHPNLASESDVPVEDQGYAKSLPGADGYTLDAGADGVIGTRDDQRGDDINLNWFRKGVNDPFVFEDVIDASTYTTDLSELPAGHAFVEIAALQVSQLRGLSEEEAIMHQGSRRGATRRELARNDATMIRLAQSGLDRTQGTADDFTLRLEYQGIGDEDDCDITVKTGGEDFAFCQVNAQLPASDQALITQGRIFMGSTDNFNWHFNTELRAEPDTNQIFRDRFEQTPP